MVRHHPDFRKTCELNGEHLGPNVGKQLKLTGKSRHGKNRVREQGEAWEVIGERDDMALVQTPAPEHHIRWIKLNNDRDFIVEILNV